MTSDPNNSGNVQAKVEELKEQAAAYEAEGNLEGLCKVLVDLGLALSDEGRAEEAAEALEDCIEKLDAIDNPTARVSALGMLGVFRAAAGHYRESTDAFIVALQEMEEMPPNVEEQIHCLSGIAQNLVSLGDSQGAIAQFTEVETLARRSVLPQEELDAVASKITLFEGRGEYQEVIPLYERAQVLFRLMGDKTGAAVMLRGLAIAYGKTGEREKAIECAKQWEKEKGDIASEEE